MKTDTAEKTLVAFVICILVALWLLGCKGQNAITTMSSETTKEVISDNSDFVGDCLQKFYEVTGDRPYNWYWDGDVFQIYYTCWNKPHKIMEFQEWCNKECEVRNLDVMVKLLYIDEAATTKREQDW